MHFFSRIKSVNTSQAKKMINAGNVIVIDVRSPDVYQEQRIEGAILADKENWDQFVEGIDRSKQVICYCYKGISSKSFCNKLKKSGFDHVYNLQGGFDAWKKSNL